MKVSWSHLGGHTVAFQRSNTLSFSSEEFLDPIYQSNSDDRRAGLKGELQPKLNQARKIDGIRHDAESSATKCSVWWPELRMVEEVEELRSKLDIYAFVDAGLLENCKIKVVDALLP